MSDITYPITSQTLPSGFCPPDWQSIINEFAANLFVTIPGQNNQLVVSATKPADTSVAWLQLDSLGRPTYLFFFAQGAWLSKHPTYPGLTMWWFGPMDNTLIQTFDGGEAGAPGPISGQMWQFATLDGTFNGTKIAAQFPITAGTLPSGKILNEGDTGGEETHSLTVEEMPPHTHVIKPTEPIQDHWSGNEAGAGKITTGDNPIVEGDAGYAAIRAASPHFTADSTGGAGSPAVVTPHNVLPPYVTGFLLQRSARLYYRID